MCFENMTFAPIDLDAVDISVMEPSDVRMLNAYHKEVCEKLSPYMTEEENEWLKRSDKTDWRGLHMADLEKNILVVIPVNEAHKKFLEEKAASGDKNCCIRYVSGEEVTKEDAERANVIIGNVDPSLLSGTKNLELLQLNSAGQISISRPV